MPLFRIPVILLAAATALPLSACDKSGKNAAKPTETASAADKAAALQPGDGEAPAGADEEKKKARIPLSQELLGKLAAAKDEEEAANLEQELWDAWLLSGSPTVDILMKRGVEAQEAEDKEL